jgi:hypothetical protein
MDASSGDAMSCLNTVEMPEIIRGHGASGRLY